MGLKETLALVITADVKGAVRGLEDVGHSADRNLGKTDQGLERTGQRLTSTGAAMVGFGAIALVGLGHAAMAAEEANLSTLKLQNSMANNQSLAGQSTQAFEDLATGIMNKTAADDDDIISGEAVLAQMGLTADQITNLTPLVVDLSRKMGVDMDTAAKTVAKSVSGSGGALKKMGIDVDQTRIKTDGYGATMDALKNSVGGFAEQEGKTFSGQIERMGNQLHNLEEGVGVGVVQAFGNLFTVVEKVTGAFEALSPGAQGAVGEFATYGAVAVTAIGATSALIGMLTTAAARFGLKSAATTVDTVATEANTVATAENAAAQGVAGSGAGSLLGALGPLAVGIGAVALAYKIGSDHAEEFTFSTEKILAASTQEIAVVTEGASAMNHLGVSYKDQALQIANESIPAAYKWIDALAAEGVNVDAARAAVDSKVQTEKQAKSATDAYTASLSAEADQEKRTAEAVEALKKSQEALITVSDRLLGTSISLAEADLATEDALNKVIVAQGEANGKQGIEGLAAQENLQKAVLDAAGAIDQQAHATADASAQQSALNGVVQEAPEKHDNYVAALARLAGNLAPDSPVRQYLQQYIDQLYAIPTSRTTKVSVVGSGGIPVAGSFADGGVIPGPIGKAQLAVVHGGETVIPTGQPGHLGAAAGPTIIFQGPVYGYDDALRGVQDALAMAV